MLQGNGGVKAYKAKTESENNEKQASFIETKNANSRLSDNPKLRGEDGTTTTTTTKTIAEAAAAKEEEDSTLIL